jgi:hypothetical protein
MKYRGPPARRLVRPDTTTTVRLIAVARDGGQLKEDITLHVAP